MSALAALLAAGAGWVLVGSPPGKRLRRLDASGATQRRQRGLPLLMAVVGLAAVWALFGGRVLGWVVPAVTIAGTAGWLVRRSSLDRAEAAASEETARAAHSVALLLRAGHIPTEAVVEAADDSPCLAPAASAVRLGGNVGEALLEASRPPGRAGLARIARAWRVSEASGAPVADVVAQVAETMRQERQLEEVIAAELSAARASGRIMALLPFLAIGLGVAVGADPVSFLFHNAIGQVLLVAGVGLASVGVVWTERIAQSPMAGVAR